MKTTASTYRLHLLAGCALAVVSLASGAAAQSRRVTPAQWRSDIDYLAHELPKRHPNPFHDISRADFVAQLERVKGDTDSLSDTDIAMRVQQAVASLNDEHTELELRFSPLTFYPLRIGSFDDGLFVEQTTAESARACGAQLVAIDGIPADEVVARVGTMVSAENEAFRHYRAVAIMTRAETLRFLGVTSSPDTARFTFANGPRQFDLELHAVSFTAYTPFITLLNASADWPLYLQKGNTNYWYAWDGHSGLLYLKYNLCVDSTPSFDSMMREVFAIADSQSVQRFVVDLRDNPGGDNRVVKPLIDGLRKRPQLRGRLYAISGAATASSGMWATIDLRSIGAIVVGGPTGGKPNAYGNQMSFTLPASRLPLYHSSQYYSLVPGDPASVFPDIAVSIASGDFFARRDPILDSIVGPHASGRSLVAAMDRRRAVNRSPVRTCPQ